jgi:perosamine synthetase
MKINQFDPYITKEDLSSLTEVIRDNWITEGKKTEGLQNMLRDYCKVKHVIMLPNGTLALYVAMMIAGIGAGDEVIVPVFTFVGSATSIVLTGAKPVFVDVNIGDFNIAIDGLKNAITPRTKAIMPVHIYGQSAKMDEIMDIAKDKNLKVIEDAAQGIGVTFGNRHVGTFGNIGCMSFYADKTITTGEGGAIMTDDDGLADKCRYFKNQGRLKRGSFVHPHIGFNFRITDLQAALGLAQMKKLDYIIERKIENETLYKSYLKNVREVKFPEDLGYGKRVPFRVNILVDNPENLSEYLSKKEIGVRRFFYPLHLQPCFNDKNCVRAKSYKNAGLIYANGLSLPSGVNLTKKHIKHICNLVASYYEKA